MDVKKIGLSNGLSLTKRKGKLLDNSIPPNPIIIYVFESVRTSIHQCTIKEQGKLHHYILWYYQLAPNPRKISLLPFKSQWKWMKQQSVTEQNQRGRSYREGGTFPKYGYYVLFNHNQTVLDWLESHHWLRNQVEHSCRQRKRDPSQHLQTSLLQL